MNIPSIVKKLQQAVSAASGASTNPEGKLRELVGPIWEEYLQDKNVSLSMRAQDEKY